MTRVAAVCRSVFMSRVHGLKRHVVDRSGAVRSGGDAPDVGGRVIGWRRHQLLPSFLNMPSVDQRLNLLQQELLDLRIGFREGAAVEFGEVCIDRGGHGFFSRGLNCVRQ